MTGQTGYFFAAARVADRYRGLAFQADEPDYPADLVEVLCVSNSATPSASRTAIGSP